MNRSDEDRTAEIAESVINECNVYPLPETNDVIEQVEKVRRMMRGKSEEPTETRIVRRVTKAFEIKTKLQEDCWISYEGELMENKR